MQKSTGTLFLTTLAIFTFILPAFAAVRNFDNQLGNSLWCQSDNWVDNLMPNVGDDAIITGISSDIIIDGCTAQARTVQIGVNSSPAKGVNLDSGSLTIAGDASKALDIGYNGDPGQFTINDGTLTTTSITISRNGDGAFTQNGGTVTGLAGGAQGLTWVGYNGRNGTFTINNGTFNAPDFRVQGAPGTININGGTLNVTQFYLGFLGGNAQIEMTDGTINTTNLLIGTYVNGVGPTEGTFHMTGGEVNVNNVMHIGRDEAAGHFQLDGGTLYCANMGISVAAWTPNPGFGTMDITAGQLILDGDKTVLIGNLIADGYLTAYDGNGTIEIDYDGLNPGQTTVWAEISGPQYTFYVSPNGNDNWPGTEKFPFQTIEFAKQHIRPIIATGLPQNLTVYLKGGTYALTEPIFFEPEDGSTNSYRVIYKAYPGEKPVISGGVPVTGWQNVQGDLWTVTMPEVAAGNWWFRQFWRNGERCQRSRTPNPDQPMLDIVNLSGDLLTITVDQAINAPNPVANDTEFVMYHFWASARAKIASINVGDITTQYLCGTANFTFGIPDTRKPAYLESHPNFIDQPTEWHLDRNTGVLTYMGYPGENPNNHTFIAPVSEKLLIISGDENQQIENITFEGICFQYTQWNLPPYGYSGGQAGWFKPDKNELSRIVPLAVEISYSNDCRMDHCYFANLAQTAVGIGIRTDHNVIITCEFTDIGGTAVMCGWTADRDTMYAYQWYDGDIPIDNVVINNYIHDAAAEWFGCVGIFESFCRQSKIQNNIIHDLPYTGISTGYRWGPDPYQQQAVRIENNHIYDVMKKLDDGGGIYTLGDHQQGEITGNLIHDVYVGWREGFEHQNQGIYCDALSRNIFFENNITYNIDGFDILMKDEDGNQYDYDILGVMTWGPNYFDVPPTDPGYPAALAAQAGTVELTPELELSLLDNCTLKLTGKVAPWAQLETLKIMPDDVDIVPYVQQHENGQITAQIPRSLVSSLDPIAQAVITDPDGHSSPQGQDTLEIILGDLNGNSQINSEDLLRLGQNWLVTPGLASIYDLNCDRIVDFQDFMLLALFWQTQ